MGKKKVGSILFAAAAAVCLFRIFIYVSFSFFLLGAISPTHARMHAYVCLCEFRVHLSMCHFTISSLWHKIAFDSFALLSFIEEEAFNGLVQDK